MAHALGVARLDLYLQFDRPMDEAELGAVRELIRKRGSRAPVAYLLGEKEFHSLPFHVDARVLVPRPETELLVEAAQAYLAPCPAPRFCDVGTGSGCIAVTLLHGLPHARGSAIDISAAALEVARLNAERHGVLERLDLRVGDLLAPLEGDAHWGRLDAVVSNPPYIVQGDPSVEEDVLRHEPPAALFVPGDDPLELVERIAQQALAALRPGGLLAFEVGCGSAGEAAGRLTGRGYVEVAIHKDLAGIERVITAQRAESA